MLHETLPLASEDELDRSASPAPALRWETAGTSRIPFASYTSDALHRLELERFFYKNH